MIWADIQHYYDYLYLCLLCLIADWMIQHIHFGSHHVISVILHSNDLLISRISDEAAEQKCFRTPGDVSSWLFITARPIFSIRDRPDQDRWL